MMVFAQFSSSPSPPSKKLLLFIATGVQVFVFPSTFTSAVKINLTSWKLFFFFHQKMARTISLATFLRPPLAVVDWGAAAQPN